MLSGGHVRLFRNGPQSGGPHTVEFDDAGYEAMMARDGDRW